MARTRDCLISAGLERRPSTARSMTMSPETTRRSILTAAAADRSHIASGRRIDRNHNPRYWRERARSDACPP